MCQVWTHDMCRPVKNKLGMLEIWNSTVAKMPKTRIPDYRKTEFTEINDVSTQLIYILQLLGVLVMMRYVVF